jgi:hypothetical protein
LAAFDVASAIRATALRATPAVAAAKSRKSLYLQYIDSLREETRLIILWRSNVRRRIRGDFSEQIPSGVYGCLGSTLSLNRAVASAER